MMKKPMLAALVHLFAVAYTFAQAPAVASIQQGMQTPRDNRDILTSVDTTLRAGQSSGPLRSPRPLKTGIIVMVRIAGDSFFKDLSNVGLEWEVLVNGMPGQKGSVPYLPVTPKQPGRFRLPVRIPAGIHDEVFLNISYRLKKASASLPAGCLIAGGQFIIKTPAPADLSIPSGGELSYADSAGVFTISAPANGVRMLFNKQTGWLQHYEVRGSILMEDSLGLKANFWQTPADTSAASPAKPSPWLQATLEPRLQLFSTSTASDMVIVRSDYELTGTFCNLHIRYTINARGEMQVEQTLEKDTALIAAQYTAAGQDTLSRDLMLPRFGMRWDLPPGFDSVTWYGQGQQKGSVIGIYRSTAGTSNAVRWWRITGQQGKGLLVTADSSLLRIDVSHDELPSTLQTQLEIDYPLSGRLPWGNYRYSYKVTPVIPQGAR